jgi:xanthine dehydrogenase small subunit
MSAGDNPGMTCRGTLRFVLDGEIVELSDVDPNRTVLQYLRDDLGKSGTKEGCAEGDCGACTVVIVDTNEADGRLQARAVNSCILFLPTIDGKELLTVESLSTRAAELHPAQKAMVDCHGSQCGFCTPGFVMSLFALYKSNSAPIRRDIDEALAGNLCRCTGYSPIVDAAREMVKDIPDNDEWLLAKPGADAGADELQRIEKLNVLKTGGSLRLEGSGRIFFAPRSLDEFADLVAQYPSAMILAGGTDVGLWVSKQQRNLQVLIYTGSVREIRATAVTDKFLDIGAAVSLTDAMPLLISYFPALEELFVRFASLPIRNVGTLGGNIANGSPIGDSMPALLVLDTQLILRNGNKTRSLALADFYPGYQRTALQAGEFIERILVPLPATGDQVQSYKVSKRFDQDISAVCGAYQLQLDDGVVAAVRVAYGGMAAIPARATQCEQSLLGHTWNEDAIKRAMLALDEDFSPISDMRSSAEYRRQVCKNLLLRFYLQTSGDYSAGVYGYGR